MCAAILFGKVNRVQCHANVVFSNAVCLVYETKKENFVASYRDDTEDEDMDLYETNDNHKVDRWTLVRQSVMGEMVSCACLLLAIDFHMFPNTHIDASLLRRRLRGP